VTLAVPVTVTVTGPLEPLLQPLAVEVEADSLTEPEAPLMTPVPFHGAHWLLPDDVPDPVPDSVPDPTSDDDPLPFTETILTELPLISNVAVPV
jgi:hypothetical protein